MNKWLVVIDQNYYPEVHEFSDLKDALGEFAKISKVYDGNEEVNVYLVEVIEQKRIR